MCTVLNCRCFADASKSVVGTGSKYNNMHGGGPSGGGTGKRSGTSGGKDSHSGPNTSSNDVSNPIMHPSNTHHSHFAHHSSSTTRTFTDKYTDATAAIYEEWFVIKKNKFGIKQERTFGIDSRSIFNAKRSDGGKASDRNNVRLAQRDIDDIIKFEKVEGTDKTFRITWQEDNIQYAIEYACESERDCTQIIKKLTYIRNARNRQK